MADSSAFMMNYGLGNVSSTSLNAAYSTYDPSAKSWWSLFMYDANQFMKSSANAAGVNAGISAVGSLVTGYYNSRVQNIQREMQQRAAEFNARQAERAAQSALMASNYRVGQISEKYESVKSSQKASMAANGIVLGVGSAAEVATSTDINKRRSIANEIENGYERAAAYRIQGASYSASASALGVGSNSAFQGLGDAASAIGTGVKDYLYLNDKNRLRS